MLQTQGIREPFPLPPKCGLGSREGIFLGASFISRNAAGEKGRGAQAVIFLFVCGTTSL